MSAKRRRRAGAAEEPVRYDAFAPVDHLFLIAFRVVVAAAVVWDVIAYFLEGRHVSLATRPFRFTYYGFSWIEPWSPTGMSVHFVLLALFAILLAFGVLQRLCALILFVGFTYVFLLEKAYYLNHDYFTALCLLLFVVLPSHRPGSVDGWWRPAPSPSVPSWALWLVRFHVALPYVYGGIAKLNGDWLRGQPMRLWLPRSPWRYLLGPVVEEPWFGMAFSWGGLLLDLLVVPMLLWRRTRLLAFVAATAFHLMNAFMFDIGVFPWLMIGGTLVFFPPDWPRQFVDRFRGEHSRPVDPPSPPAVRRVWTVRERWVSGVVVAWLAFHLLFPFRHLLYPGNVLWTEEGHRFSWQMMLRTKQTGLQFVVADPEAGWSENADVFRWLDVWQFNKMSRDPEMLREFAAFLGRTYAEERGGRVEVYVVALCALNGREEQLLVDPRVDLASVERTVWPKPWILPLDEQIRR